MPTPPAPSPAPPAYVAAIVPFDLQHPALRRVRLSQGQAATLAALTVPIVIDGALGVLPCAQAETALRLAASEALGRETCAVLHQWSRGGELWVLCDDGFAHVGTVELTPARMAVAA